MAASAASYGHDLRVLAPVVAASGAVSYPDDIDAFASEVDGVALVAQDIYHRLTNDSVMGSVDDGSDPNPDADNWGFDVTRLCGMPASQAAGMQPTIVAVIMKDERISGPPTVTLQQTSAGPGLWAGRVAVHAQTAFGPFSFVLAVSAVGAELL